jgi:hypothetical protein
MLMSSITGTATHSALLVGISSPKPCTNPQYCYL